MEVVGPSLDAEVTASSEEDTVKVETPVEGAEQPVHDETSSDAAEASVVTLS